ncbi:hypothetical protein, partial [Peterkaempfera griseoplana]|uniref:hypothetical protein n=1 Tax=Peterkaempfera griseoplana TaxID=66896 RepID=UPI0012FEF02A
MGLFSRTTNIASDTQHHLDGEVSKWHSIAEGRRAAASETDDPAEARRLLGKAKDADGNARAAARTARRARR